LYRDQKSAKAFATASPPDVARILPAAISSLDNLRRSELDSKQLFADANELFIRHDGERYTLRRTSKGKLILTK
jgi:hemin uptake protein HemP